jgi:monofunctional biosynthetic peptidoglycan transglycosylase
MGIARAPRTPPCAISYPEYLAAPTKQAPRRAKSGKRSVAPRLLRGMLFAVCGFYGVICLCLISLKWVDPFTTAVQMQRRVQSWMKPGPYHKEFTFVAMEQISPALQHAAVAAEDARFYQHHGFDWTEVQNAVEERRAGTRSRGASTITQQLVKNLFLTTSSTFVRKGIEATIVPLMELVLSKKRILELYLNVIEWGPGIYGAEAAARHYYRIPARRLSREQAIDLSTVLPAPLRRKPGRVTEYSRIVSDRMAQMGW